MIGGGSNSLLIIVLGSVGWGSPGFGVKRRNGESEGGLAKKSRIVVFLHNFGTAAPLMKYS